MKWQSNVTAKANGQGKKTHYKSTTELNKWMSSVNADFQIMQNH